MSQFRMRYRERLVPIPAKVVFHNNNGTVYHVAEFVSNRSDSYESFDDVIGSRSQVHPCKHITITVASKPRPNVNCATGWGDVATNYFAELTPHALDSLFPGPSSTTVADMMDKSWEALVPQVPQEVSIPNFFYELRELGGLIPKVGSNLAQTAGGGYLSYQFGLKPLIGDLQAIAGLLGSIRSRLEYLRETWGRETRVSFQTGWDLDISVPTEAIVLGHTFRRLSHRGIFRCGGYLYHELQDLDGLIGEFRALSAATGLNNPLGVIWEAIPFSFLADWLGRVGRLVSRTPIQPFAGKWEIRRLTHSFSWSGTWEGEIPLDPACSPLVWNAWSGANNGYVRDVGLPVSTSVLHSDSLSPQQQLLAAALLGASLK